jgi:predicted cupin superfamily sugar epimerase
MTAAEVINRLGLKPLPHEGGYYAQTWRSASGTAIYFLLTPEEGGFSALHKLTGAEIYHFYAGDPVQLVLFPSDGGLPRDVVLGNRLDRGECPQFIVPEGTVQGSRLVEGGRWALLGTTMAPGYTQEGFELSKPEELLKQYPEYDEWIAALTRREGTV